MKRWAAFTFDELVELSNGLVAALDDAGVFIDDSDIHTRLYREINDEIDGRGPDAQYIDEVPS